METALHSSTEHIAAGTVHSLISYRKMCSTCAAAEKLQKYKC